jgi:Membrane dipeptidase (Peptidase family M19)
MFTSRLIVSTLVFVLATLSPHGLAGEKSVADSALERAKRVLRSGILIDGHNDLPYAIREWRDAPRDVHAYDLRKPTKGDTDIARLRAGGLSAQFWSVYIPGEGSGPYARQQLEQIDIARRLRSRYLLPMFVKPSAKGKSPQCSGWKVAMASKILSGLYAPTMTSAFDTWRSLITLIQIGQMPRPHYNRVTTGSRLSAKKWFVK